MSPGGRERPPTLNFNAERKHFVLLLPHVFIYSIVQYTAKTNAENFKQIFPEKEYQGLSPYFHIHVSVSELYISTMGLPFLLEEICGPI